MRRFFPGWLPVSVLFVLVCCTFAHAGPGIGIANDRAADSVTIENGSPIDLVVTVDPAGEPLRLEGLEVRVTLDPADAGKLGDPILPPPDGEDEYRKPFEVRVPFLPAEEGAFTVRAAIGDASGSAKLAIFPPPPPADDGMGDLMPFDEGVGDKEKVSASAVLRVSPAKAGVANAVLVKVKVREGWHVYGEQVEIGVPTTADLLPAGPERLWVGGERAIPDGEHLHGEFTIEIPFTPVEAGEVSTRVSLLYMACTEQICDPVRVTYLPLAFEVAEGEKEQIAAAEAEAAGAAADDGVSGKTMIALVIGAILSGLLALAMPCTYPMIPITISFFTKQAEARQGKVAGLAFTYGFGIVAIFASIGLLVGATALTGENVLAFANHWLVNSIFAILFLVFGLSLIGLFEIRLPSWFDDLAMKASGAGGLAGVFAMGATLVITSFTCTAPFVGTLLAYAAQTGDWRKVTLVMAVFGLTMAIPFVFLSLSPKAIQKLPKSGVWMKHLKVTLGILELGLMLKFLSNVDLSIGTNLIGRELFIVLWGSSFFIAALYLLGVFDLLRGAKWSVGTGGLISSVILLGVTAMLAAGLGGRPLISSDLEAFLPRPPTDEIDDYGVAFAAVVKEDYEKGLRVARELGGKPVFEHYTGFM